jgi:hypothetical protein
MMFLGAGQSVGFVPGVMSVKKRETAIFAVSLLGGGGQMMEVRG